MATAGNWEQERRAPRARVDDIVLLQRIDDAASVLASLTDISTCGMGVDAEGLREGEMLSVSLAVGPSKKVVKCGAIVRHANGKHHGLEFLELSEEQVRLIAAACSA